LDRYQADFDRPAMENVALLVYLGASLPWSVDDIEGVYRGYVKRRHRSGALRLPDAVGVAVLLHVAEHRRAAGEFAASRERITEAVEEMPGFPALRELESWDDRALHDTPLPWRAIVLPGAARP
jgi:hypothetical protein